MITVCLNFFIAIALGVTLTATGVSAWYWSILWTILIAIAGMFAISRVLRHFMGGVQTEMQLIMAESQQRMQAKIQRWRTKPVSSPKAAEQELAKDRDEMIARIQALLQPLEKYRLWIPLLGRQLATMELQFAWQKKDWKRVDLLFPRALMIDPMLITMRLARMWQQEATPEELETFFRKVTRRARYGSSALLYAAYSWMLVRRNDIDGAHKVLIEANEKNEHPVLKSNRDLIANNRVGHFSNAGFGEEWYALWLEEPKIRAQRQRHPGRYFG